MVVTQSIPLPLLDEVQEEQWNHIQGRITNTMVRRNGSHTKEVRRRVCVDPIVWHESVWQEAYPLSWVGWYTGSVSRCKCFSKLDSNSGVWQTSAHMTLWLWGNNMEEHDAKPLQLRAKFRMLGWRWIQRNVPFTSHQLGFCMDNICFWDSCWFRTDRSHTADESAQKMWLSYEEGLWDDYPAKKIHCKLGQTYSH